ncbi:MAG: ABC transporter permease [Thermoplasmata archaeon]|nr:ABC transporter permease [Thermoplasmata archaeon]MCK5397910.1 ABC transporter permease [Thermoplasmata archaeon]
MKAKQLLSHSAWICWKDLLEFARSKMALVMLLLMPLFMMIMVGFIFPDSAAMMEDVPIALVDLDSGPMGENFTMQLEGLNEQTGMMVLSGATDIEDIRTQIYAGDIDGGIVIPANFTQNIMAGQQGTIIIMTDQSNPQLSMQTQQALSYVIDEMGTYAAIGMLSASDSNTTLATVQPYTVEIEDLVEGDPSYFQFVAPGIMAMVVMMSLMTGLPHAISYEKDTGTLDGMLVAPIHRLAIILGKVLAQTTRGMIQGILILLLAMLLFGVVIYGNILIVLLIMLLTVLSFVGLGILVTSFTDKEETASMIMMTMMFPMMFLGGVFFPIEQMPGFMQTISSVLPLTYATSAMRKVMILGAGMGDITTEILFMVIFGLVFLLISVPMFKRAMNK